MVTAVKEEIQWALDVFNDNGIEAELHNAGIVISKYSQPKGKTFEELGINEDELIKNVIACRGCFDTRKSKLTTFPLVAAQEIRLHKDTNITQMPNLKVAGVIVCNKTLKKLPKLKTIISINMDESPIKSLPKLKEAGIIIAQNSKLESMENLEKIEKLCVIDCPLENLSSLKIAKDVFLCSSNEENKLEIHSLNELEEVDNLFVANSNLKTIPKLKKAGKIALFNSKIKSIKKSLKAEAEIETKITDEELSQKFDNFTDWYNSDVLNSSMNMLGDVVKHIKS